MAVYRVETKVDQIVTKEVRLDVVAGSEEEAQEKARAALQEYPKPVHVEGVDRILTTKANYWIPRNIDFVKISKHD